MRAGTWNIIIGGFFLIGGLSGRLTFIGTNSSSLLAVLGGAVMAYGIYQLVRTKK